MCLQYTDFSKSVIGSFVPVLSDGSLKREVSLSLQDIHSVPLLSPPLRQADRMRSRRRTGRTDGQRRAGGDGMKHPKEFLADHYLTHRQGKAISTATNSYFSPAPAFHHSKFYLQLIERYPRRRGHGGRLPKNTQPGSNQVPPAHYAPDE